MSVRVRPPVLVLMLAAMLAGMSTACTKQKSAAPTSGFDERSAAVVAGVDADVDLHGKCVKTYRVGRDGRAGGVQHWSLTVDLASRPDDDADLGRRLTTTDCQRDMRTVQQRVAKAHGIAAPIDSHLTVWFLASGGGRIREP